MKRICSFLTVLAMIVTILVPFPITATAETATSGTTGDCTWTLDGTTLTISGNGAMADYSYNNRAPWGTAFTELIVSEGVTHIGNYAFAHCSGLKSVTIPNSVTTINHYSFFACTGLTSIAIPNSVITIGEVAFSGCSALTSVTIGNSVTSIGADAFNDCDSLTSVALPNSVITIENSAFRDCNKLSSVIIPESVNSIGPYAFYYCYNLTSVTIPHTVTFIGSYAFETETFDWLDDVKLIVHEDSVGYNYALENNNPYEMTPHSFEITFIPSTCTVNGSETKSCNSCGTMLSTKLPLLEHNFENGICFDCGYVDMSLGVAHAIRLLKHIDGIDVGLTDEQADINGDGKVTVFDAVRFLQTLNTTPIE